jgi:hypothetical protein
MQYTTTIQGNRHIEVLDERQLAIGTIDISGWTPQKARIATSNGIIYDISPKGFWAMSKSVLKNDMPYAELKPNMTNGIYINYENGPSLLIKKKNWCSISSYVVVDNEAQQVATIETIFSWKGMGYNSDIDIAIPMPQRDDNHVLPLLLAYGARILRIRM